MNSNKQNFGPEFPAGLEWSQGAKNTWKNYGTSVGDTMHSRLGGAPTSETHLTSVYDGQKVLHSGTSWASQKEGYAPWAPRGETTSAFGSGPPKGDTNRFFAFRNELLSQTKTNISKQSGMGMHEWQGREDESTNKHSRSWYIDLVKSKHQVMEEFQKGPDTTAIAVNFENNSGSFSPEQKTLLTNAIMMQVFEYEVPDIPDAFVPKFYTHKYIQGLMVFKCFDRKTAHWLTTLNFSKLWNRANIDIFVERDFTKLVLCKVSIPEPIIDSKEIFHILKLQNKDICMNRWKIIERTDQNFEIQLKISMDEISINILKNSNMHLHYGIGKVQFHILQQNLELPQQDDDFSIDNIINPKELESDSSSTFVAKKSQDSWVTSGGANISQKMYIDSMRNINPFSKINQPIITTSSRIIQPTPTLQHHTDISAKVETPRYQDYPAISRHIESIERQQKDYIDTRIIEPSTRFQHDYSEKLDSLEKNIPDIYSDLYRKDLPNIAYDNYISPDQFENSQNLYRSESPKNIYRSENPDNLYRPESPTNVYQSESPEHLYRSEYPDNLHESESPLRPSEMYQESRSPSRHYTDNLKSYSEIYADPYSAETSYKIHSDSYQRPLSPNYSRSRDRSSPIYNKYRSHIYQESSLEHRGQSRSPERNRESSRLRSRERSHHRSREQSPLRSKERSRRRSRERSDHRSREQSPLRSRERSHHRSREQSPLRSRERSPPRYRDQGRSQNRNREPSPLRARNRNRSSPGLRHRRSRSPNLGHTRSPPRYPSRDQSPPRYRDERYRR